MGQNDQIAPSKIFSRKTITIISISLLAPLIVQYKTIIAADPELWWCTILGPEWLICPEGEFFGKAIDMISMYISALFIAQNLKKILKADPELWDVPFSGSNWLICPEQFFFAK